MGDAAAAKRGFTAEENRESSNKAARRLIEDLRKQLECGTMRDLREVSNRLELCLMLWK